MRRYYSYPLKEEPLSFPVEPIARKFAIFTVLLCFLVVLGNFAAHFYFAPAQIAEREMEKISRDYYESEYYDKYINDGLDKYAEIGLPRVFLRQLLLFDNSKHAGSRARFNNDKYFCDTNRTVVIYYPYAPYGRKDYTMKIDYSCQAI